MPKDPWNKARRRDQGKRAERERVAGYDRPSLSMPTTGLDAQSLQRAKELLRGFSPQEGGYAKTYKLRNLRTAILRDEAMWSELGMTPADNAPDEQFAFLVNRRLFEKGGEVLGRSLPIYRLLSLLEDGEKAEALRQACLSNRLGNKNYTITLTRQEYDRLQSALSPDSGRKI